MNKVPKVNHLLGWGIWFLLFFLGCTEDPITPNTEVTIRGRVFDQVTEMPLADSRVTLINTFDVVQTDTAGVFSFDSLRFQETYSLRIEKAGYIDQTLTVNFSLDGTSFRDIEIPMDIDQDINNEPETPRLITPEQQAQKVPITITFRWSGATVDQGDNLSYTLFLYTENDPVGSTFETTDTFLRVDDLQYDTRYFWQVSANDQINEPSTSLLSSFQTIPFPNFRVHFVKEDPVTGNFVIHAGETPRLDIENLADSLFSVPLTSPDRNCWRPHLNIAANRIAYISFVGADAHLFTMNRDGSDHHQVTSTRAVNTLNLLEANYAWSPNGGQFIYPHKDKLMVINENGTGLREFATADLGYFFTEVDWANQGVIAARMQRANRYQSKIVLYREDGTLIDTLLNGSNRGRWMGGPVLAEGANFLLFTEDRDEEQFPDELPRRSWILRSSLNGEISTVNAEDIPLNTNDLYPMVPPGGEIVIFVNRPSNNSELGDITIMQVNSLAVEGRAIAYPNATMPDWR